MKRYPIVAAFALTVALFASTVAHGQAPPGPSTRYNTRFTDVAAPAASFDIVQQVVEFAPGAAIPFHSHGGPAFVTVIEGELTFRELGKPGVSLKAGETIHEPTGHVLDVANASTARARVAVAFLLPPGAIQTTLLPGYVAPPNAAKVLGVSRSTVTAPAPTFDVVTLVLDFAPGVFTAVHQHGGPGQVTVFEGTITRRVGTTDTAYPAGQGLFEAPGPPVHSAGNLGSTPASLAVTFLHPPGVPLTTVVAAPGPPATGTGATPTQSANWPLPFALVAIMLLGVGTTLAVRSRR